jgi:hypothetical protein
LLCGLYADVAFEACADVAAACCCGSLDACRQAPDSLRVSLVLAQAEFWSELSIDHPSAQKLHKIGQCIEQDLMQADKTFLKMLHLNMNSVQTMRRYAYFLAEV